MTITNQTQQELVIEGANWTSVLCTLATLPLIYVAIRRGKPLTLVGASLFSIFVMVWVCKMTFIFDTMRRVVRWTGRKVFKLESGM